MNRELNSLTWKYFWQQKIEEVSKIIIIGLVIIFIPYLLGHNIGDNIHIGCSDMDSNVEEECSNIEQWIEGILYIGMFIVSGVAMLMLLFSIWETFQDWLKSNWERAEERAKDKLRNSKQRSKE